MNLTLSIGEASGDWNSGGAAGNDNWGAAATGGEWNSGAAGTDDWNSGAAGGDGFTSQDARAAGDGFGSGADEGTGGGGDGGACRNCGQGMSRSFPIIVDSMLNVTSQTVTSLASALSRARMAVDPVHASIAVRRVTTKPSAPIHELHEHLMANVDPAAQQMSTNLLFGCRLC
jgi:hypothetical protein